METEDLSKIPIFFILGRPRSGTTLLTTLFNAHPNIRIAPEFPVMMFLYQRFKKVKKWDEATIRSFVDHVFSFSKFNVRRVENLKFDKEFIISELLKYKDNGSVQLFLKSINYYAYSIYHKEETLWIGDKNPVYSIFAYRLRKIFPDAKFVCIIRDYRDNFISIRKLVEKDVAVEAPSLPLQVGRWRYFTHSFFDCKRRFPDKYYILRYEDLVMDQEKTFRSLCDFLGIDYDPSVFDFHKRKEDTLNTYGNETWEKFHGNLLKPINTGSMNTWQGKLTDQQVKMADQIAGKYADLLGYQREHKGFNLCLFLKSSPMLIYNYILLFLMTLGTYFPYKAGQWWFFKSLFLLKIYMKIFGQKSILIDNPGFKH
ncbi:MAG: sulfotransferase [Bacteroidales bacterium]|nr:sulfotransferase [Bacteroidales bacterium]